MHRDESSDALVDQALAVAAADSVDGALERIARCVSERMAGAACTVWRIDKNRNGLSVRFSCGGDVSGASSGTFIPYQLARDAGILSAESATEMAPDAAVRAPALEGCLFAPLRYDGQTHGILAISRLNSQPWPEQDREFLASAASAVSIACGNLDRLKKTTQLADMLHKLSEATYDDPIFDIALDSGKTLLECDRALVRLINLKSGKLEIERSSPKVEDPVALASGDGITGRALMQRKPLRVDDVTSPEWSSHYHASLKGSRSELAVPILLPNTRVRVGTKLKQVDKPFGVLSFESPAVAAFSSFSEECAQSIAQHMARVFERIEFNNKLDKLRRVERDMAKDMAKVRDWDSIVDRVMKEIVDTLGYEYVSLSIVSPDSGTIRCIRVLGLENAAEFQKAAVHDLKGPNIQADIVRTRLTEVPAHDDPRLNGDLSRRFGLGRFIRVFIPVLAPARNEVLGTVSAGYDHERRSYIYERDVQILKGFVDFAGVALDSSRRGVIYRASHEMNAPLSAVRNNLSRLLRHRRDMTEEKIDRVLEGMATDAEILHHQVQQLE